MKVDYTMGQLSLAGRRNGDNRQMRADYTSQNMLFMSKCGGDNR